MMFKSLRRGKKQKLFDFDGQDELSIIIIIAIVLESFKGRFELYTNYIGNLVDEYLLGLEGDFNETKLFEKLLCKEKFPKLLIPLYI